jgi:pimeloyl-ACP methyl ester carboxylesterase
MGILILLGWALGLIVVGGTLMLIHRLRWPARLSYGAALAARLPTEPADLGVSGTELTVTLADGSSSPALLLEGKRDAGPMVVLVHGWGDSRFGALERARSVLPLAWRVLAFDQRGHGDSESRGTTLGVREPADLLAVVRQVDTGGRAVVLVGWSMGAGVAIAAGARWGAQAGGREALPALRAVVAEAPYREAMGPVGRALHRRGLPVQPFLWLAGRHMDFWHGPHRGYDRADLAAALSCPLWVVHGSMDTLCTREEAQAIAQASPRGRFVEFPKAGHFDLPWSEPERWDRVLREAITDDK